MQYKIGDKVEVVGNVDPGNNAVYHNLPIGHIGVVTELKPHIGAIEVGNQYLYPFDVQPWEAIEQPSDNCATGDYIIVKDLGNDGEGGDIISKY